MGVAYRLLFPIPAGWIQSPVIVVTALLSALTWPRNSPASSGTENAIAPLLRRMGTSYPAIFARHSGRRASMTSSPRTDGPKTFSLPQTPTNESGSGGGVGGPTATVLQAE